MALIPSPADEGAAPIHRIRAIALRAGDGVELARTDVDVSPTDASWEITITVPIPTGGGEVVVVIQLINVAGDGTETVQFSGRAGPIALTSGETVSPEVDLVRGPTENLETTGVEITSAPADMVVGATSLLVAEATTSAAVAPTVFWTSLDPGVVAVNGATALAEAVGTARVVASAGAHADTVTVSVRAPLVVTTASLPDGVTGVAYAQTVTATGGVEPYAWAVASGALPDGLTLAADGAISGTPSGPETANVTVEVTSADGQVAERSLELVVHALLQVTTASLPDATEAVPYAETLAASGGAGPRTWAVVAGALPAGMSLAADGSLAGTPSSAGASTFTVEVSSADAQTAQQALSLTVNATLQVVTASLPDGTEDAPYAQALQATGGVAPYTWMVSAGSLPPGVTLAANGSLTGSPTDPGSYDFTAEVASADGQTAQAALSITVHPVLSITTASLPDGVVDAQYQATLQASGGLAPLAWTVTQGALPDGVVLGGDGTLSGAPVAAGSATFTVQVSSADGQTAEQSLGIDVHEVLTVTTASLPDGVEDAAYDQTLVAAGGLAPFTWTLASGSLPAGLGLAIDGTVTGTPTGAGFSDFTIEVASADGQTAQAALSITIHPLLSITTASLPDGVVDESYQAMLAASGGLAPLGWSVTQGALPDGVLLAADGSLSGTPVAAGSSTFTVQVTSSDGQTAEQGLSIDVYEGLTVTTASLPDGVQDVAYDQTLTAVGGLAPLTWTVAEGTLPTGVTLATDGSVTGAPSGVGLFEFTVEVASVDAQTAQAALAITVHAPLTVTTTALPNGVEGVGYAEALGATGGLAPYTWTLVSGALPADLDLAADGTISGTPSASGLATFTVEVASADGQTVQQALGIDVYPLLAITTAELLDAVVDAAYDEIAEASGGDGAYSWSLALGVLPGGLDLDDLTGGIAGIPVEPGTYGFTLEVASGDGQTAQRVLSIEVLAAAPTLVPGALCSEHPPVSIATFADANLEMAIRSTLGLGVEDPLTCETIAGLPALTATNLGITALGGIQNLTGLTTLNLSQNPLTDLAFLSGLTGLTELRLAGSPLAPSISDISPLASLTNLTVLDLNNTGGISDIGALASLTSLSVLSIRGNAISDISPLAGLTSLTSINLAQNQLTDVSALAGLTNLTFLAININQLTDISPIAGLTNLAGSLWIMDNQITNLDALSALTNVTTLYAGLNAITDISGLAGLTGLAVLDLRDNQITDITVLDGLTGLQTVQLMDNNDLVDLQPLVANPGLGSGDVVNVMNTSVSCSDVADLQAKGVTVTNNCTPNLLGRWINSDGVPTTTASVGETVWFQLCYTGSDLASFQALLQGFGPYATLVEQGDLWSGNEGVHPDCAGEVDVLDSGYTSSGSTDPLTALIVSTAAGPGIGATGIFELMFDLTSAGTLQLVLPNASISAVTFSGTTPWFSQSIDALTVQ